MAGKKLNADKPVSDKLTALRKWMKDARIDAFVVPYADRFQSENISDADKRLKWLTGFSGSAGSAIVLKDKAAAFVDGRYTIQAPKQINTQEFDIVQSPPLRPAQWLAEQVKDGAVIGLDPWLFTVAQARVWQKAATEHGWELKWVERNPIDMLWTDRPLPEIKPAQLHPLKHSGQTKEEKIKLVLSHKSTRAKRLLVTDPGLVGWLMNLRGNDVANNPLLHCQALVEEDGHVTLFVDPNKMTDKLRSMLGDAVTVEDLPSLLSVIGESKSSIQFDPMHTPQAVLVKCQEKKIPVVEAEDPALLPRAMKNWVEVRGAQTAHDKDKLAFKKFMDWFEKRDFARDKITELDVVAKLHECRAANKDFVDNSFDTIAGFGANGAIVHYRPAPETNLRLRNENLLLLDSGAQYLCGTTDVTRTLAVGKPTAQMKKHYTAVLKGLIALSTTRFPQGATGAQLDGIARRPIWDLGLDYAHGTGHGVGSYAGVHEGPQSFSLHNHVALQPGMIVTIEPGIYLKGRYGIRLENMVVVVKDKLDKDKKQMLAFKTLTKIPFDNKLIDWKMLNDEEEEFLLQFGNKRGKVK